MGFYDKQNNADGKDPDFGAIFMSNSATKRECFKKGLFGLPPSAIQFVEKVKAGTILFLFEYEKRQLHGVFKASSDGAVNIVPNAFSSLRKQFPAQVKFIPIWHCKPLSESLFRDAIRENYFAANKFNFGLSEMQVCKLLHLFSMRKLELEVPGRLLTRMKDLKSESFPVGKAGRSVDHGMHVESVKDELRVGANVSPVMRHKFQGDSLQYYGEAEFGFNASGDVANKQGRAAELAVDTPSGYVGDYLPLQDEFGYATHEKEHYMDIDLRPIRSGGYSRSPSDKIRIHDDGMLSTSHRLSEDLSKTGQRMVFSDDNPGLHHSNVNPTVFYSKPGLEHNSLVQNQLRPTSAMIQPIQAQFLNSSCATNGGAASKSTILSDPDYALRAPILEHNSLVQSQIRPTSAKIQPINSCARHGDVGSKSNLLYDPDYPGLNFSQSSSVRINNGSRSILESASLSSNCGMNSSSNQTCLMPTELNDVNRCHDVGCDFLNHGLYGSDRDCMPFNVAQNADQLAAESVGYEAHNGIPSLNSSSAFVPPSDIGNSDTVHEPFSSLFHSCKSYVGNHVHPIALRANLGHEMTLEKNNESFIPDVPWANEGHSQVQYGDSLVHEYDTECYGNSQNNSSAYPKKKNSVFSRLTFIQDVKKQENGNNALKEGHVFNTSVDQVMEMVRQSQSQWMLKRKPKPLVKRNKAESLRDKTQIISSRIKSDCFESILNDASMDLTAASDGNTSKRPEETCFVDFKRRSKVRKLNDESEIRSSYESVKSENVVLVQQKRRKLIRPNFSKNATSDDKGIDLGVPQDVLVPLSHENSSLNNVSENGCSLVETEDDLKTDAEGQDFIGQTHSEDKRSIHAREFVCDEGVKARDGTLSSTNDGSECLENINNQNASSSASCKDKSCHIQKGLPMMDSIKSVSLDIESLHSISQEHHADMVICADTGVNTEEGTSKDGSSSCTIEVKDGSDCFQKSGNENAPNETSCHINEGSHVMDSIKSVSRDKESLHSICQEHHVDNIICAGRSTIMEAEMSKDGGFSFTIEDENPSECIQNSGHEKAPSETSSYVKEASCVMDSIKPVSPDAEALHSICQEHHVCKIICAGRGIDTEKEMSKDGGSSLSIEVKDGSDSLQKSGNENGPIATSFRTKEGLHMIECVNSVAPDTESLHSTCQEHHVDKIICAGRGIDTEEEMSKSGSSSFTTEVTDGSDCSKNSGNDNAPIATCEQKMI